MKNDSILEMLIQNLSGAWNPNKLPLEFTLWAGCGSSVPWPVSCFGVNRECLMDHILKKDEIIRLTIKSQARK